MTTPLRIFAASDPDARCTMREYEFVESLEERGGSGDEIYYDTSRDTFAFATGSGISPLLVMRNPTSRSAPPEVREQLLPCVAQLMSVFADHLWEHGRVPDYALPYVSHEIGRGEYDSRLPRAAQLLASREIAS